MQFSGFGSFDYGQGAFENLPPTGLSGSPRSFSLGDFDLFTNTRISQSWSVLAELLITSDFTNTFSAEMDRFLLSYKPSRFFNIAFGKFNTSLGYYPNAFHRAQYFQTAVGRPVMYGDEDAGGILPVHSIGVTTTGMIPGALGLHWVAELSNGTSSNRLLEPIQNFVDENNGKALNLAVYAKPEALHGFQTGFSFYQDVKHLAVINAVHEDIFTGHLIYVGSKLEFLNEASFLRHAIQDTPQIYRSMTAYSQISYAFGKTRPYVRYDYENIPLGDPIFGLKGRTSGPSIGVNRRLASYVALKLQYGRLSQWMHPAANAIDAQLAFAF